MYYGFIVNVSLLHSFVDGSFLFLFLKFILLELVFCLHVCLCEGATSPGTKVTDSCDQLGVLGIEHVSFGRAAMLFIIELFL